MSDLRVAFNAYLLTSPSLRGWTRYTLNLLSALPAHGVRPLLYANAPIHESHLARLPAETFDIRVSPPMRYFAWEQWWVPQQLRADAADVIHSPFNYGLPWATPCPRVLTLHDAIDHVYNARFSSFRTFLNVSNRLNWLRSWSSRRRAHRIITVSQHAKGDLVRLLGLPAERVTVVSEAADSAFTLTVESHSIERVKQHYGLKRPFILYLGGWERRKNLPFLVRAFAAAEVKDVDLVFAGGKDDERAALISLAEELGVGDKLRLLSFVSDEDLSALYAAALVFTYPSEYEGFGLQLVEAMAIGCPVLAARATSLPEVLGAGGETFGLDRPDELVALLRRVTRDSAYRAELIVRAKRRASDFSWDQTACETAEVYHAARAENNGTNRSRPLR